MTKQYGPLLDEEIAEEARIIWATKYNNYSFSALLRKLLKQFVEENKE